MATKDRVTIELYVDDQGTVKIRSAKKELQDLASESQAGFAGAAGGSSLLNSALLTQIGIIAAVGAAAKGAFDLVVSAIKGGITAIEEFNLKTIGIAVGLTNIAAEGQGAFGDMIKQNMAFSKSMYERMREEDSKRFASLDDLMTGYNILVQKGYAVRMDEVDALGILVDKIKLATAGQNTQFQVMQEIRGLMDGQVRAGSILASEIRDRIGPQWESMLEQHRKAGTLLKWLASLWPGISAAAKEVENTLEAQTTTLQGTLKYIGREGMATMYQDVVDFLKAMNEWLRAHSDEIAGPILTAWNSVRELVKEIGLLVKEMADTIYQLRDAFPSFPVETFRDAASVVKAIREALEFVNKQIDGIKESMDLLKIAGSNYVLELVKGSKAFESMSSWIDIIKGKLGSISMPEWLSKLSALSAVFPTAVAGKLREAIPEGWKAGGLISPVGEGYEHVPTVREQTEAKIKPLEYPTTAQGIQELIKHFAQLYGVSERLAIGVAKAETTGFQQTAISPKGALGVMQIMPGTAESIGFSAKEIETNVRANIHAGVKYLRMMLDEFGNEVLAAAAYNAGPGAVRKYQGVPPFAETQKYITKVFGAGRGQQEKIAELSKQEKAGLAGERKLESAEKRLESIISNMEVESARAADGNVAQIEAWAEKQKKAILELGKTGADTSKALLTLETTKNAKLQKTTLEFNKWYVSAIGDRYGALEEEERYYLRIYSGNQEMLTKVTEVFSSKRRDLQLEDFKSVTSAYLNMISQLSSMQGIGAVTASPLRQKMIDLEHSLALAGIEENKFLPPAQKDELRAMQGMVTQRKRHREGLKTQGFAGGLQAGLEDMTAQGETFGYESGVAFISTLKQYTQQVSQQFVHAIFTGGEADWEGMMLGMAERFVSGLVEAGINELFNSLASMFVDILSSVLGGAGGDLLGGLGGDLLSGLMEFLPIPFFHQGAEVAHSGAAVAAHGLLLGRSSIIEAHRGLQLASNERPVIAEVDEWIINKRATRKLMEQGVSFDDLNKGFVPPQMIPVAHAGLDLGLGVMPNSTDERWNPSIPVSQENEAHKNLNVNYEATFNVNRALTQGECNKAARKLFNAINREAKRQGR